MAVRFTRFLSQDGAERGPGRALRDTFDDNLNNIYNQVSCLGYLVIVLCFEDNVRRGALIIAHYAYNVDFAGSLGVERC